ncbi:LEAF RUST 10 DISEASE-RESISTANCE LOCUS RECEPTOR-LIKE PROTEIN KINASE-like 2.7 [Olea europaea var. sylvestris]|uniref:LEAF RUST 10 DISEASE-RESISTANCE LOCUS RECEPTOR-LIKE PROTEIN KINASE-like 2.7 n=1 Tax=Olea europaea var. sylvestris TaxID=158386 RepID=UPI000C1CF310|nr:LEAF RUST 10 DISEASE-RESISTANCE LOCUS RECEPTOR-LIKE PROTEIN KINASE-like 2.7 [Olea europaea var. sylvestris]
MDTVLFFPFIFQRNSRWKRFFINVLCFLVVLLLFAQPTTSSSFCKPAKCGSSGPPIRFPFRLKGRQSVHCGYLGFDLSCNNQNQTVLNLPQSGEFILDHIDYTEQAISIKDPDLCLPKRILNFNLSGSPFHASYTRNYTFLNCSSDWNDNASFQFVPLLCLSGKNHSVFAMNLNSSDQGVPATCRRIMNVSIPQYQQFVELRLIWNEPGCEDCESRGGMCGFKSENGSDIGCSSPPNSVVLLLFAQPTISSSFCKPAKCGSSGPPIRFPFRLKGRQSVHCGYLGFDLSCNNQNQTVLNLPQSGEFILDHIDYIEQAISIKDPDLCLPKRILNFNLSGSPFHASYTRNYTFLNCSSDWNDNASFQFVPLLCLSGKNHSVFAMNLNSSDQGVPATCRRIMNVSIPQFILNKSLGFHYISFALYMEGFIVTSFASMGASSGKMSYLEAAYLGWK